MVALLPFAVHPQRQLQHEQFLVDEPAAGRVDHALARRTVNLAKGLADGQQRLGCEHVRRKRLGRQVGHVGDRRLHRRPDHRLRHALGERIDGKPVGGVRLLLAREPTDLGMVELPDQPALFRHTSDHHPHAGSKATVHEGHVEPDGADVAVPAGEEHGEERPAAGGRPRGDTRHLTGNGGVFTFAEIGDRMRSAEVAILTREMHEGIGRRDQFQADEFLRAGGAHARQTLQRRGEAPRAVGVRGWRLPCGWRSIHAQSLAGRGKSHPRPFPSRSRSVSQRGGSAVTSIMRPSQGCGNASQAAWSMSRLAAGSCAVP